MVRYECKTCNYKSELKSNYARHLKSKKHGKNIGCEIIKLEETALKSQKEPKKSQKEPKKSQKEPKKSQNNSEKSQNDSEKSQNDSNFECDYCDKVFSTFANKRRHELHRCKYNKELSNKDAKIKILEKEKKELYKKIDELIKKVGDTNIQNNIIINSYGNEDLSHITDKIKDELLKIPYGAIPKLIETIHFNDNMPQNKNIKFPNKKENVLSVYEGDKWVYKDKNETINALIDSKYNVLDNHYDETECTFSNYTKQSYCSFKKVYEEGDEEFVKDLKKECDIVLLNNRN
jgi:hypothetical protein